MMRLLDLTLASPEENIALDEALLDDAEHRNVASELLRLWEPRHPVVVVGRSSQVAEEVHLAECRRRGIPIFRRASGGAAIVTGPGCLMYAVVASYDLRPQLHAIDQAHQYVLQSMATAIGSLGREIQVQGISDLTWNGRKISGNSLRCKRTHLLYHGTILNCFPLDLVRACLKSPPRQPEYRRARSHQDFVANLNLSSVALKNAIAKQWDVTERLVDWPSNRTRELVAMRYSRDEWNFQR